MAKLHIISENGYTEHFPLERRECVLGRQPESDYKLDARDVSRRHARIVEEDRQYYIEDLGSSNGTFVNNCKVSGRLQLNHRDRIQIGPYVVCFLEQEELIDSHDVRITASVPAAISNSRLFRADSARKLQVVLEIAQHMASNLDVKVLLPSLLERLMALFLQADRSMIMLVDHENKPQMRAIRNRYQDQELSSHFSRAIVQKALTEGVGIVAEDARADKRFNAHNTLSALGIQSFVCAPLKSHDGKPMGVVILDRFGTGNPFQEEDLMMLTAIALQASMVLENAAMHQQMLTKARMDRDLSIAAQVQEGFLPEGLPKPAEDFVELSAEVIPAHEIAGDFYDVFMLKDGKFAFTVADISGKGISAALLMSGIRTLTRHLLQSGMTPAKTLQLVNDTLAEDNPHAMFVTMVVGTMDLDEGEVILSGGGHPPILVRRNDGRVERLLLPAGRLIGFSAGDLNLEDSRVTLAPHDTLFLYTDGLTEAHDKEHQNMFGLDRLMTTLHSMPADKPISEWADRTKLALEVFTNTPKNEDDVTLFLLRRRLQPKTEPKVKITTASANME